MIKSDGKIQDRNKYIDSFQVRTKQCAVHMCCIPMVYVGQRRTQNPQKCFFFSSRDIADKRLLTP